MLRTSISMVKNLYLQDVLLKIPKSGALATTKKNLLQYLEKLKQRVEYKSVRV